MSAHLQRASVLLEQGRHELAEQELRAALAEDPNNGWPHSLLALCLTEREAFAEAGEAARQGVHLAPDAPLAHYALAYALFHRIQHEEDHVALLPRKDRYTPASAALEEAIRLDPEDPDFFSLRAAIHLALRDWPAALASAEQGLRLDSEHVACANVRALALVKLGRNEEAGATIGETLRQAPNDALTHANQGWALLHRRQPREALEHFREALRLDPQSEWARQGIVEALKARHLVYRWMLAYFLFMSRLSAGQQWGIVIGGYLGLRFLGVLERSNPSLDIVLGPLRLLLVLFVFLSWSATHLFNLLLRLDRFGRHALSEDQKLGANAVGLCLAGAVLLTGAAFWWGRLPLLLAAVGALGLTMPVGATFSRHGRARFYLGAYTVGLIVVGAAGLVLALLSSPHAASYGQGFALGLVLFSWFGNLVGQR